MGWEVYDEAAWESAAQKAAQKEAGKVRLNVPHSAFSVMEGNRRVSLRRRGELVRAVRAYKAILPGTFLSYEKDDVMEIVNRCGSDGKCIYIAGDMSKIALTVGRKAPHSPPSQRRRFVWPGASTEFCAFHYRD